MNKKVLNVMIWLTWGILAFFLIAKLFFGEWYAIVITKLTNMYNSMTMIVFGIDLYFWLLLYYFYQNKYKKEN